MKKPYQGILFGASLAIAFSAMAGMAAAGEVTKYADGERRSGFTYAKKETQMIQTDDLANPGYLWVDEGESLWSKGDGPAGRSCATCHGEASKSMKTVGATWPKYSKKLGKMQSLEQRINQCRTENVEAKPFKWESKQMLGMTAFIRNQSLGETMSVSIDGPAVPFFEKGKAFYEQKRGQLDMSCKNCHEDYAGGQIRANTLTQGQSNGFPVYRLKWQKPGSIHRRFRGCNKQVRAKPYGYGSDEYVNLELYVAWRGRGLQVETPAIRN